MESKTSDENKWLVIYEATSGMAEIYNVGLFVGTREEALQQAAKQFITQVDCLAIFCLEETSPNWTFYI